MLLEKYMGQESVPFNSSVLNKWIQVLLQCHFKSSTAHMLHGRQDLTMNTVSLGVVEALARQSLLPLSIVGFVLRREMQVEVAVHSVLRNHSVAESTFIRTAALRRRQLCPHVNWITQLGAPERLLGSPHALLGERG